MKKKLGSSNFALFLSKTTGKPFRMVFNEKEYEDILAFMGKYKDIVFLRDCLDLSLSLSMNRIDENTRTEIGELEYQANVQYLSILDNNYPKSLLDELGINSPTVLSYRGNAALLSKNKVGFSGSRKVSDKGLGIATDIATQLSCQGFCLVSGYANGVDMIAHKTALANGASTILVLPEGISYFYVRKEIAPYWDWNRVLVVSEFDPQAKWMVSRAMKRNSTLIALSQAMLVIKAGEKGGSLDAGLKSIDYGKRLFVPQYAEFPTSALGNALLIQHDAYPLRMKRSSRKTNLDMLYASVGSLQPAESLFG